MGLFIPRLEKLIHRPVSTPGVYHTVGQDASSVRGEVIETPNGLQASPPTLDQLGKAGMLVLTRKKNESIVINDVIKVTVVEIRGDKVRLGIEAPSEIDVYRQEVYERIQDRVSATGVSQELAPGSTVSQVQDEDQDEKLSPQQSNAPQSRGMLVLTRKRNESIVINDVIKVTVVEIRGDKVRLGIEAPREIDVHRQEIYEQIHSKRTDDGP